MNEIKEVSENDLTQEEWDEMMNQAGILGFKLFVLGLLTLGIYPIIYWYTGERRKDTLNERKKQHEERKQIPE